MPKEETKKVMRKIEDGLKEILKREGAYNRDPLIHAQNTIRNMEEIATRILKTIEENKNLIK